uniref:Uncharacterized protein n=1 Tax=Meloidogyne enterolobii TaxID=390850 RepID=A0A6V7TS14_MELEN|nr:unnamed protein product [Meloidogyne enterolobii]
MIVIIIYILKKCFKDILIYFKIKNPIVETTAQNFVFLLTNPKKTKTPPIFPPIH